MKLKLLLFLCSAQFSHGFSLEDAKLQCDDWFPEPISYKLDPAHTKKSHRFEIIEDFCADRDDEKLRKSVHALVVATLNGRSSGYSDVLAIVFRHLPTIRQIIISVLCLITALLIFLVVWKLLLFEVIEVIVYWLDDNRSGFTIIPIFCILGLTILAANLRECTQDAVYGRTMLETANDHSFMPIKERLHRKLSYIPCLFKRDFAVTENERRRINWFLHDYANFTMFNKLFLKIPAKKSFVEGKCKYFEKSIFAKLENVTKYMEFSDLNSEYNILVEEYQKIILNALNISIPVFGKALASIEEFVSKYHDNVLLLPSGHTLDFYQTSANTTVTFAVLSSGILTILFIMKFEFRKKYSKILAQLPVPLSICSAIFCLMFSTVLICRLAFITVVHEHAQSNNFQMFSSAETFNISENGQIYMINYGHVLAKAVRQKTTLFSLLVEGGGNPVPEAIRGSHLFKPTRKFNESVEKLMKIAEAGTERYVETACRRGVKMVDDLENRAKELKKEGMANCTEQLELMEMILEKANTSATLACDSAKMLQLTPINHTTTESPYTTWTRYLLPREGSAVMKKKSVQDVHSPMQVYLVFENPSKKLRPTVLEHMLRMSLFIVSMVPIHFVLAVYFMFIVPLLLEETAENLSDDADRTKNSTSTLK